MSVSRAVYWAKREHSKKKRQRKASPRRGKPVICKGIVYESVSHAAKANNLTRDQLRSALRRKTNPGHINGLRFSYLVWSVDNSGGSDIVAKSRQKRENRGF
jgi:hypothetical protein